MKTIDDFKKEFDEYYWRKIYPSMFEKEKIRNKYVANFKKLILLSCVILPIICVVIWHIQRSYEQEWIINLIYFSIVVNAFVLRGPFTVYKKLVKNDIMECFIKFFENFKYEPGKGLSHYELKDNYIFPMFDEVHTDDCFVGSYKGVGVRVCEEELIKYRTDTKGRRKKTVTFLGIVLELDMNKSFFHQTYVIKDLGFLNRFHKKKGFEKVSLEDVLFEKEFEAYSENQIEARYLLTPAFMERMLKLKELYKGKSVQFSFYDSKVTIAINTNENMFEPCSLLKTNLQNEQIYKVFEQFMTIFSVIDILKLNQNTKL